MAVLVNDLTISHLYFSKYQNNIVFLYKTNNNMTTVGVISDTHSYYDQKLETFLSGCDILIHAGDIGSLELADKLAQFCPLVAVSGNIDNHLTRSVYPQVKEFNIEDVKLLLTHIGGYPGNYNSVFRSQIASSKPDIVICGHSHILKVMYDKNLSHLHINPGAAGISGFHKVRTAIRFKIDKERIFDLEVGQWERANH